MLLLLVAAMLLSAPARAQPFAAVVMDMRSGEVFHAENADTRLHPASLTKMMTLYIAFEAIANGEITLDTRVRISRNAASEPPSRLGLRAGQSIALRYLIRASAVRSGNDAATAIAEAISGSEAAFAERMTRTARAMGMRNTTFRNAHGLTAEGHLSTARDMAILSRQLFFDYPQYYNLFSRRTTHAGVAEVTNTNRRLLDSYRGADGIKTGYTRAAGFNLAASAERNGRRVLVTVFGGRSIAHRTERVTALLDLGFARAPARVAVQRPPRVPYQGRSGPDAPLVLSGNGGGTGSRPAAGRVIRLNTAVARSPHPQPRPGDDPGSVAEQLVAAVREDIADVIAEAADSAAERPDAEALAPHVVMVPPPRPDSALGSGEPEEATGLAELPFAVADPEDIARLDDPSETTEEPEDIPTEIASTPGPAPRPAPRPASEVEDEMRLAAATPAVGGEDAPQTTLAEVTATAPDTDAGSEMEVGVGVVTLAAAPPSGDTEMLRAPDEGVPPPPRGGAGMTDLQPAPGFVLTLASETPAIDGTPAPAPSQDGRSAEMVLHLSTQSPRLWHISLGRLGSRDAAERMLMRVALAEAAVLDGGLRRIETRSGRFEATYVGLTERQATLACARLAARGQPCEVMHP